MFTEIQTYLYQLRNDPTTRKKFFITIGIIILLFAMVSFIVFVNTRDRTVRNSPNSQNAGTNYKLVSSSDFDISQGLEQVYGLPILNSNSVAENGGDWAYINRDYKLVYNGEIVESSPNLIPRSVYVSNNGVIVNSLDKSFLYKDGEISSFVDKAHSLVPSLITKNSSERTEEGYVFLLSNQKQILIFETGDVFNNVSVRQVAQFNLRDNKQFAELRVFNGEPYLFTYSDITRTGEIDVWQINNTNKLVRSVALTGVESVGFSDTGFVYTVINPLPTELSQYETRVVDYTNNVLGDDIKIDVLPRIAQSGVYGTMYAERCVLNNKTTVVCLIKIRKVISTESAEQDRIVRYDFINDKLDYPYQGVFLSGDKILFAEDGFPYIIGQENRLLYRLDTARQ